MGRTQTSKKRLSPEPISQAIPSKEVLLLKAESLDIEQVPTASGVYCFVSDRETLYVGEASSLRARLKKHLDHSDNKYLARWIWQHGMGTLTIELHVFHEEVRLKTRKALETELIRSRRPSFNVLGKLA